MHVAQRYFRAPGLGVCSGWSAGNGVEGGAGRHQGKLVGATPTANSQGPPGLESAGLPWAPGAGSVCGAGERRAEPRPGIAGCWGSSGSGQGRGRWRGQAEPLRPPSPPGPATPHTQAVSPHLCVLRLQGAPGPQALQHLQLPEVHFCAGGPPAPACLQLPGQLHGGTR